jgi:hypothetical protein
VTWRPVFVDPLLHTIHGFTCQKLPSPEACPRPPHTHTNDNYIRSSLWILCHCRIATRHSYCQRMTYREVRLPPFWDVTRRSWLLACWRFGTTYRSHLQRSKNSSQIAPTLNMGPIGCPETSVANYQPTSCNISEEQSIICGGSLKSRIRRITWIWSKLLHTDSTTCRS